MAVAFAAGSVPAAYVGGLLAQRVNADRLRLAFGWLLVAFAVYFVIRLLIAG